MLPGQVIFLYQVQIILIYCDPLKFKLTERKIQWNLDLIAFWGQQKVYKIEIINKIETQ